MIEQLLPLPFIPEHMLARTCHDTLRAVHDRQFIHCHQIFATMSSDELVSNYLS